MKLDRERKGEQDNRRNRERMGGRGRASLGHVTEVILIGAAAVSRQV